jgi:stress response protein SCP2
MIQLKAGQNIPLTGDVVRLIAKAGAALDISALVVAENLRVLAPEDFVFHNRPRAQGVTLSDGSVTIRLAEVRADANAVLLVASAASDGQAGLGSVTAELVENDVVAAEFAITPLAGETALICLEVYRRGTGWKLRAVGQGYAGGFTQLLTAHGVEVDDVAADGASQADPGPAGVRSGGQDTISGPQARDARAGGPVPVEVAHGLDRLWMIFEDASPRSSPRATTPPNGSITNCPPRYRIPPRGTPPPPRPLGRRRSGAAMS